MAEGELECSETAIRDFLIENEGRVKNEELVKKFKRFLNDPTSKGQNRERFKECVNAVATIKTEDGDKYLVLKKKYRELLQKEPVRENASQQEVDVTHSTQHAARVEDGEERKTLTSTDSTHVLTHTDSTTNVLNVAQTFEQIAKEEKAQADAAKVVSPNKNKQEDEGGDDDSVTSTVTTVTLSERERSWMLESSDGNTPSLAKLLLQEQRLAKQKDFTNTALHWAAKHGRKDLIRLLANQPSFNVNVRSHGGYTPLHIAAMQGQEAIVQSLISDYKADVNIRDYSGKKAKQHLKKNASNYIQRMLQGATKVYTVRRGQRSESMEKKRSSVPFFNKPLKWGSAENVSQSKKDKTPPITPPESPNINRHSSLTAISDKELMPPPKLVPGKRSKRKKKEEARESEIRRAESEPDLTS